MRRQIRQSILKALYINNKKINIRIQKSKIYNIKFKSLGFGSGFGSSPQDSDPDLSNIFWIQIQLVSDGSQKLRPKPLKRGGSGADPTGSCTHDHPYPSLYRFTTLHPNTSTAPSFLYSKLVIYFLSSPKSTILTPPDHHTSTSNLRFIFSLHPRASPQHFTTILTPPKSTTSNLSFIFNPRAPLQHLHHHLSSTKEHQ